LGFNDSKMFTYMYIVMFIIVADTIIVSVIIT
jgi:hypothetical protein